MCMCSQLERLASWCSNIIQPQTPPLHVTNFIRFDQSEATFEMRCGINIEFRYVPRAIDCIVLYERLRFDTQGLVLLLSLKS